jgi:hypothetical protein
MSAGGTNVNTLEPITYENIIKTVREWPPARRFALVQDVLNTLAPTAPPDKPRRKTLDKALGLLATARPAPSDAEIEQWLDERRMEKYG